MGLTVCEPVLLVATAVVACLLFVTVRQAQRIAVMEARVARIARALRWADARARFARQVATGQHGQTLGDDT